MREGGGDFPGAPAHVLGEARVVAHQEPQRHDVQEEADHVIEGGVGAVGERRADDQVVLAGQPPQQAAERGQQHRERRGAEAGGQAADRAGGAAPYRDVRGRAAEGPHPRPRPVPRQVDDGRRAVQVRGPPAHVPVAAQCQRGDVVREGPPGRGKQRAVIRRAGRRDPVGRRQVAVKHALRPAVERQVVHGDGQHVLIRAEPDEACPPGRALGQVEGRAGFLVEQPAERVRLPGRIEPGQVVGE